MKFFTAVTLGAVALAALACGDDDGTGPAQVPLAGMRVINAVADTMGQDIRFVDVAWNAYLGVAFRSTNPGAGYAPIPAGERHIKVFLSPGSDRSPGVVSTVLADTVVNFEEGKEYTFFHVGFARAGANPGRRVIVTEDNYPTPPAGNIAVRFVNAGAGLGTVDVFRRASSTGALTTTLATDIPFMGVSDYITLPVGQLNVAAVTDGTVTVLANADAPDGAAATRVASGIGGDLFEGSVLTAILVPRSVSGSTAASFTTPGIIWIVDRRPPILP